MDIRDLKAFIAVAEELSFRAAAERLNITQPPLTRLIANLEDDLKVKLFIRDTRKVALTASGLSLLKDAREILARVEEAKHAVRAAHTLSKGELRVGLSTAAFYSGAMKAIWKFKESYPHLKVVIIDGLADELTGKLAKQRIDIAILEAPVANPDQFQFLVMDQEPLGVLLAPDHKLSTRKSIKLKDLEDETLIMHERKEREGFFDAVMSLFKKSGTKVNIHFRQKNQNCAKLVSMGEGILLTTRTMSVFGTPTSSYIPIMDEQAKMSIGAYWNKSEPSPALHSFLSFIENQGFIVAPKSACLMSLANW